MHKDGQMNWKAMLVALPLVLGLGLSSIVKAEETTCNELLTECSLVVDKLELTVKAKNRVIKTQAELLKTEAKEIERLDEENSTLKTSLWGGAGTLLLLLLL